MNERYRKDSSKSFDDVTVCYDRKCCNWVVFWKGKKVLEFLTNEPYNQERVKKHFYNIKNGKEKDVWDEAIANKNRNEKNKNDELRYAAKNLTNDIYNYGKGPIKITSRRGDREILIVPQEKKHFHFPRGLQKGKR